MPSSPAEEILPALLLRAQRRLGLSPTQLALIIQLSDFWWDDGKIPWPKKETVGQRLNLSDKQVQRIVRDLEERGYVQRVKRVTRHGRTSNGYDLSGLVRKLQELAPEFAAVHPEIWLKTRPLTSASAHLFMKAVQQWDRESAVPGSQSVPGLLPGLAHTFAINNESRGWPVTPTGTSESLQEILTRTNASRAVLSDRTARTLRRWSRQFMAPRQAHQHGQFLGDAMCASEHGA